MDAGGRRAGRGRAAHARRGERARSDGAWAGGRGPRLSRRRGISMTQPILHATPRRRDVLTEQVRAVGRGFKLPAVAAAALAVFAMVVVASRLFDSGKPIDFAPALSMLPGMA